MKTQIILNLFYKPTEMLQNYITNNKDLYVPINCGNLKVPAADDWTKEHVIFEDQLANNIADRNSTLNEMTAIYAYWKNLMKDVDYVGFNHYRRIFCQSEFQDLQAYDMVVQQPFPMKFRVVKPEYTGTDPKWPDDYNEIGTNVARGYEICHNKDDWEIFSQQIRDKRDQFASNFDIWKCEPNLYAPCQMFIMKKDLFDEYCHFLFNNIFELSTKINLDERDGYQKRALAFLGERLFSLFAYTKRNDGAKIKEIGTMFFDTWKPADATDKRGLYE